MNQITLGKDINILQIGNEFQISGLLFSGQGQSFALSLPHKHDDINEPISQLKLDQQGLLDFLRQMDLLEVEMFQNDGSGFVKQIVRKTQRQIDNIMQWQVFDRDNYTCRYCGRKGIPMSVDHIILWEEGGPSIADNMLTACKSCNRDRGSIFYEDWIKSKMYESKSKNLTQQQKNANIMVVLDLPRLQSLKVNNIRSR